uniref:C6 domain-containing protein n=1 Tax=Panagrolaimus sp. PS1159 TaxID=55785 RepID=A0AC35FU95_9BILA
MPTPEVTAAPEIPVIPCQTCAAPTITNIPPAAEMAFDSGTGTVVAGDPVTAAMCLSFIVTCNAANGPLQIGIDQTIGTALAGPSAANTQLMATIVCNGDGVLESQAVVPAGTRVTLSTVYCSITTPPG